MGWPVEQAAWHHGTLAAAVHAALEKRMQVGAVHDKLDDDT